MSRRVALALAAASVAALAGCDGVVGATMTFDDTERAKVTDIVLTGGSGEVLITTGDVTETRIKRVIRGSTDPGPSYRLTGSTLSLSTECGARCQVGYEISAPAGVAVRGEMTSADLTASGVGAVDLKVSSGDIAIDGAAGPVTIVATSGDIRVADVPSLTVELSSGDITSQRIAGPVQARATSGDITLDVSVPASVTASVQSGDLTVMVPDGAYQIRTDTASGDATVAGLRPDPRSAHVLDLRTRSGDLLVTAR